MRKSIINSEGTVVNVVELADGAAWQPPPECHIGSDGGEIGQQWNGSAYVWINPSAPTL